MLTSQDTVQLGQKNAFTLQPDGNYDVLTGHSMAAPVVSSILALLKESSPNVDTKNLLEAISNFQDK